MSIFADLKIESVVQVADKTRLDATRSFVAKGSADISEIEIQPEAEADFISVFDEDSDQWFLDWAYATDGVKTVTVRIATDGDPITFSKTLTVLTEAQDALLSTDDDLISLESDVLKYLPDGKSSFNYMHRKVQGLILDYLDKNGHRDDKGQRLTKSAIVSKEEFRTWSKFMVLRLIFFDNSNQPDDHYDEKSKHYRGLEESARTRISLPLDTNGDGEIDASEHKPFNTIRIRYE